MGREFNYESNGSFGSENGVRTKKLGPKRRNGKIAKLAPESFGHIARDIAKMAISHVKVAQIQQQAVKDEISTIFFIYSYLSHFSSVLGDSNRVLLDFSSSTRLHQWISSIW
jgi:hypothetical protein